MAYQSTVSDSTLIESGNTFAALAAHFRLFLRRRKAYNASFDELYACSDRELNDLGIARSDIRRLALEAADAVR